MTRVDIGPTKRPELETLINSVILDGDPYIKNVRTSKPIMLRDQVGGLRQQAVFLGAEAAKTAKELVELRETRGVNDTELEDKVR